MIIGDEKKKEILKKKETLRKAQESLKAEFIGIDSVIDEVINSFEPWYIFPEFITKPIVINLWGMTGTGKSSLVKRLVELLGIKENYVHLDLGEYVDDERYSIKFLFQNRLNSLNNQSCIIAFDEFQFANTLNEMHQERVNLGTRMIWEILDTGKIQDFSYWSREQDEISRLNWILVDALKSGVKVANGKVIERGEEYKNIVNIYSYRNIFNERVDTEGEVYVFSDEEFSTIFEIVSDKFDSMLKLKEYINSLSLSLLIDFIRNIIIILKQPKVLNISRSVIFVIGNLDEAYSFGDSIDPDSNPDLFFEMSKSITTTNIKSALQKRFRNEQISRLGNNHIIYPAFNREMYIELIEMELRKAARKFSWNFEIELEFSTEIFRLLYGESVFPSQGARPVITSVNLLIESYFSKIINDIFKNLWNIEKIIWDYMEGRHIIKCFEYNGDSHVLEYAVSLKVDNKRKVSGSERESVVAVHECGHAIVFTLRTKILPKLISCVSAGSSNGGRVEKDIPENINWSKRMLKDDISGNLGGILAEELVFGNDNISSGSVGDIEIATRLATSFFKDFGMGSLLASVSAPSPTTNDKLFIKAEHQKEIESLLLQCRREAAELLSRNKTLLIELAKELARRGTMTTAEILPFFLSYSAEEWVCTQAFIRANDYYNYREILFGGKKQ